ncbi:MAG: Y-family DNA polymerase [Dictyoglomaceae bacterium]|nr:Y-family DNA polymerase [Dictyoglomaceae bacterium]
MKDKVFFIIDCDSFYVSCEKIFNPKLWKKPVVVLSNNDGCVISRSEEAKEIGIEMGIPIFKCNELVKKYDVQILSANFTLYGDISRRVMNTLSLFSPEIEIYSIDEAFLLFPYERNKDYTKIAEDIKKTVFKWVGIPVSIGIGNTKVLSKIALKIAKKDKKRKIFSLLDKDVDEILKDFPVEDIWGIGKRYENFLKSKGIDTAYKLKNLPDKFIKKYMTIVGLKLVWELRGISCIEFEEMPAPKKSITTSRSFGLDIENLEDLEEAISNFITISTEKLRRQKTLTSCVQVFLMSNPFKNTPQYFNEISVPLERPTANTLELIQYAKMGLRKIYKEGIKYKKAGVILSGFTSEKEIQLNFFINPYPKSKDENLMKALDEINKKYGRNTIIPASNGIYSENQKWRMRQKKRSKRYTTSWIEIPIVKS